MIWMARYLLKTVRTAPSPHCRLLLSKTDLKRRAYQDCSYAPQHNPATSGRLIFNKYLPVCSLPLHTAQPNDRADSAVRRPLGLRKLRRSRLTISPAL
jgi:hypothetical protein